MINSRRIKFIDQDFEELMLEKQNVHSVMEGEGKSLIYKPKEDLTIIFQDIVNEKPNDLSNHYNVQSEEIYSETLADIYIEQGNYEHAIKIYELLIQGNPDKAPGLNKKLNLLKKYLNQS